MGLDEQIADFENATLVLSGVSELLLSKFVQSVQETNSKDVLGEFRINGVICTIGNHELEFDDPADEGSIRLDQLQFSCLFGITLFHMIMASSRMG